MSDSYFIGTVARVHNLWRFSRPISITTTHSSEPPKVDYAVQPQKPQSQNHPGQWPHKMASLEAAENQKNPGNATIGMMVSLDHTIYFHRPRECKADEWLFSEMESPWAGEGRGLVLQRIWSREGRLVATCMQEVSS